jgi:hypothetical protein
LGGLFASQAETSPNQIPRFHEEFREQPFSGSDLYQLLSKTSTNHKKPSERFWFAGKIFVRGQADLVLCEVISMIF